MEGREGRKLEDKKDGEEDRKKEDTEKRKE